MKTQALFPERIEWPLPEVDNLLLIENRPDETVIHAARNNLSEPGKRCLIRHLTAEGFIPPERVLSCAGDTTRSPPLIWVIDRAWDPSLRRPFRRTDLFVIRALVGGTLLWLVELMLLFLSAR
jgi:hypothetical protein